MKRILPLLMLIPLWAISCDKENEDPGPKGLVSFSEGPEYGFGAIRFAVSVQFGGDGEPVDCSYQILNGTELVSEGIAECSDNTDGLGLFWESELVSAEIDTRAYSGRTLEVVLDPSHEITLPEYTTEQYIDLYKRGSVTIP